MGSNILHYLSIGSMAVIVWSGVFLIQKHSLGNLAVFQKMPAIKKIGLDDICFACVAFLVILFWADFSSPWQPEKK